MDQEKAGVEKLAELLMNNPEFISKLVSHENGSYSLAFAVQTIQRQGSQIKRLQKDLADVHKQLIKLEQVVARNREEQQGWNRSSVKLIQENDKAISQNRMRVASSGEWAAKVESRIKKLEATDGK